jgi:hypothetical protein
MDLVDVVAAGTLGEGADCDQGVLQPPPYKEGDGIADAKCYLCQKGNFGKWMHLKNHIERWHEKHKSLVKGSWLFRQAQKDSAKERTLQRAKRRLRPPAQKPPPGVDEGLATPSGAGGQPDASGGSGRLRQKPDGTLWRKVWLQVSDSGEPITPITFEDWAEPSSKKVPFAVSDRSAAEVFVGDALQQIQGVMQSMVAKPTEWTSDLPLLCIKEGVAEVSAGLSKADGKEVKRAAWPKDLDAPRWDFNAFRQHLDKQRMVTEYTRDSHVRNMRRLIGLLAIREGGQARPVLESEASDIKLWCALAKDSLFNSLFEIPLMDLKYSWSSRILDTMLVFSKWTSWSPKVSSSVTTTAHGGSTRRRCAGCSLNWKPHTASV